MERLLFAIVFIYHAALHQPPQVALGFCWNQLTLKCFFNWSNPNRRSLTCIWSNKIDNEANYLWKSQDNSFKFAHTHYIFIHAAGSKTVFSQMNAIHFPKNLNPKQVKRNEMLSDTIWCTNFDVNAFYLSLHVDGAYHRLFKKITVGITCHYNIFTLACNSYY